jgi:poly-D-alanine transfer protein DltD
MDMLDYRMMTEVFLFLSVFDKWKSGKVIVVISPRMWLILSGVENPDWCVRVSCAVDCEMDYLTPTQHSERKRLDTTCEVH